MSKDIEQRSLPRRILAVILFLLMVGALLTLMNYLEVEQYLPGSSTEKNMDPDEDPVFKVPPI